VTDLLEFSRQKIEHGSKSFAMAARLFPPDIRASCYMLYAWCRHCDDVVDDQVLGFRQQPGTFGADNSAASTSELVEELEAKTRAACRGTADEPVFQALAEVCKRHEIPERFPLDLIAGFEMDAGKRVYTSIEDTLEYSYHVAGVVGVMMTMLMGARDRETLERASDLGIAFQLTNIARDVVADHEAGRVYLPELWLFEAGLTRETMASPENLKKLYAITERLLDTAEPYYASAERGLPALPWRCAWAVASAARIYRAIGLEIRRLGPAAWDGRAATTKRTKFKATAVALRKALASRRHLPGEADDGRAGLWTMR